MFSNGFISDLFLIGFLLHKLNRINCKWSGQRFHFSVFAMDTKHKCVWVFYGSQDVRLIHSGQLQDVVTFSYQEILFWIPVLFIKMPNFKTHTESHLKIWILFMPKSRGHRQSQNMLQSLPSRSYSFLSWLPVFLWIFHSNSCSLEPGFLFGLRLLHFVLNTHHHLSYVWTSSQALVMVSGEKN